MKKAAFIYLGILIAAVIIITQSNILKTPKQPPKTVQALAAMGIE